MLLHNGRRLLVGDPQALPALARDGTSDRDLASCNTQVRHAHGRNPEPSAGVIDSCSIKVSPVRGPRGFDGVKKIDGIKRHVVVDTLACWWPCWSPRPACRIGRRCPGCSAEPATAAPGSAICGPSRATPAAWCRP